MPHYSILSPLDNIVIKCLFFLDGENSLAWCWLDLDDAEILKSVLKRMKEVPNLDPIGFLAKQSYQSSEGNSQQRLVLYTCLVFPYTCLVCLHPCPYIYIYIFPYPI